MTVLEQERIQTQSTSKTFRVIGRRVPRPDGVDKVTGRAQYGADVKLSGMLYGKVLRSPHAHARIVSIDTREAEALPGVKAVITGKDFKPAEDRVERSGEGVVNYSYLSQNVMAQDKVLYHGHAVAAVAATNPHIAEEALARIKVEYEVLPPVLDVLEAMREDAPILLPNLRTRELGEPVSDRPTNIASHEQYARGDVERGFAEADVIVEREFRTSTVHQGYIEPQNATALWNADGFITVWTSTQAAWDERRELSEILHVPISNIRVIPMEIGGGFGGKLNVYLEPLAALLSLKAGHRPVKMWMQRDEVLKATGPTSASVIRVKVGARRDGVITAAQAWLAYEAGAFPGSPVGAGMGVIFAPYRLENLLIDGYDVVVNKPAAKPYRAPGGTNAAFASETVVDELAEKLGMDPIAFRRINAAKEGDRRADGPVYGRIGYIETLDAIANHPHYRSPLPAPSAPWCRVGRGVASGFWFNWDGKSSASAIVNPDGTVSYLEGSTDIGGTRASLAMQLAETLGIDYTDVRPMVGDTQTVGYNDATGGSRTTYGSGIAAYHLGKAIIRAMKERAARLWDVPAEDVDVDGDTYCYGERCITFKALCAKLEETGGPLSVSVSVDTHGAIPALATHVVDVEVDIETGKVSILRYTAAQDVGRAIHPDYVEGQIHGGVAQGIGWALNEEYVYDADGHLLNASLLDYRMPTALDLPMIETVLVEVPNPNHPFGVKGVGEVPIVPPAAAIANAIYRAIGVRMTTLPMKPSAILKALGTIP
ncbi:MAG: xanthine dehydrogenase family protein molybdopterin-binding subunit [Thermoflexales bacterium]|nr:xanthine dehydrogenase family protein molybdopterin-binding subunit [Thermoflexales bacterium]